MKSPMKSPKKSPKGKETANAKLERQCRDL